MTDELTDAPLILIVEDSSDMVQVIEALLESLTLRHACASTGEEALEYLQHTLPDLMLLDIGLPGMNGWTMMEIVRERLDGVPFPVIALTGYDDPANQFIGAIDTGVYRYVIKPFDVEELIEAIWSALNRA